jgi:hypothetical protein
LNPDKEKYLNYETSTSGKAIENVCVRCHDSDSLDFFALPKAFNIADGGYARVRTPEMIVLKENGNIKIIVDEKGPLLALGSGNKLSIDKSYCLRSGNGIQMKAKRKRKVYCCCNIINHILSTCQNCHPCKNNLIIDIEIKAKIKSAMVYNIANEYKDGLIENKAHLNILTTIVHVPTDMVNEPNSK